MGAPNFYWILVILGFEMSASAVGLLLLDSEDEVFKAHFPTAWSSTGISSLCYNDSQSYLQAYLSREKWASKSICQILKSYIGHKLYILFYSV